MRGLVDNLTSTSTKQKPLLQVLSGKRLQTPPVWLMRQAGRFLPEYRAIRSTSSSFMDFCFSPAKAAEATLQPIRRFGFDAAILFSDILVIPEALGQKVSFEQGEGPRLDPLDSVASVRSLRNEIDMKCLEPVFETVDRVKSALPKPVAFIGFCGAPWTVATYMIAGRGTRDQEPARTFAYRHPEVFQDLIDLLVRASIEYLGRQIQAGVEVVQLFDSWAGVLPTMEFKRWSLEPMVKIADAVKSQYPHVKVIAFPRGAGTRMALFTECSAIDGIGLDTAEDCHWVSQFVQPHKTVQGNLDPLALRAGGDALRDAVRSIVSSLSGGPHIFNLGHGILPDTPVENVELLLQELRHNGN